MPQANYGFAQRVVVGATSIAGTVGYRHRASTPGP
jgi:hypothetical protein